ncbi:MAG: hypothetical protein R3B49_09595 [Phycisphaerales bacterium]
MPKPPPEQPAATVRIMCPNLTCRKILAVPKIARGKTVRCRNCGTMIRIPEEKPKTTEPTGADTADHKPAT